MGINRKDEYGWSQPLQSFMESLRSTWNSCWRNRRRTLPDLSVALFCVHSWIQASIYYCSLSIYSARFTSDGRTAMCMPHLSLSQVLNSCSWMWRPKDINELTYLETSGWCEPRCMWSIWPWWTRPGRLSSRPWRCAVSRLPERP